MIKPYLIKLKDNTLNHAPKTKYKNKKNNNKKDYLSIIGLIIFNLIFIITITLLVIINLLINLFNNCNCKTISFLLKRENFN